MNVGVVGLVAKGMGVARQLLAKSFQVHGCGLRDDARKALVAAGGSAHESPAELGAVCEALIVVVVSARQATDALFVQQGAAQTLRRGAVVISCVTASPADNKELADRLDTAGIQMIEAPVSGGIKGAADRQLTLMASGPDSAFDACTELLQAISSKVYRLDTEHGMASKVKIINQMLVGVHIAATAEAMALGLREGVDPDLLYDVIKNSAGNSWAFTDRAPRILKSEFVPPHTALDVFVKDLGLVLDAARVSHFPLPLASAAYQMFANASRALDWAAKTTLR